VTILVDTATVPAEERFAFWADGVSRALVPLDAHRVEDGPFAGQVVGHDLGAATVHRIVGDASLLMRTAQGIATRDPEHLELALLLRGRCRASQGSRDTVITPGDLSCWQTSRPFSVHALCPLELLIFSFPLVLLGARASRVLEHTASRVPSNAGIGCLAAPFLLALFGKLEGGSVRADDFALQEAVVDLARAVFGPRGVEAVRAAPSPSLLLRIQTFIQANLGDPELSPTSIAQMNSISKRYLHKLFEAEGVTVSSWIRLKRLERCRRDLQDPALAHQPVRVIAERWGLRAAYFHHAFRATFGCTPGELRGKSEIGGTRVR
jgi:AraC-like DNA-binding protein